MSLPLLIFMVVLLTPLVTATWRLSVWGLAFQGGLLAWMAVGRLHELSLDSAIALGDLGLLRGLVAPLILYLVLTRLGTPERVESIPANLLSWTMAGGLVLVAFRFAQQSGLAGEGLGATHLAVATTALLLGFFILATRREPLSQIFGLLRIENAIALFELASAHEPPAPVRLALSGIYLATVLTFVSFLVRFSGRRNPSHPPEEVLL